MACAKASSVRAAFARKSALTLDPHASIGDKSGVYGGRESRRTPAVAQASTTPATLWAVRLAMMRTWPGRSGGTSPSRRKASKTSPSVKPSTVMAATRPLQTQGPQHGDMAPPIDGLGRLGSLAPGSAGVEAGHRLMAASFIEKEPSLQGRAAVTVS